MLAAYFVPKTSDESTLSEAIIEASRFGMVPCAPRNFSPEREFSLTFFPPGRVPSGWKPVLIQVKSSTHATVESSPCAA